MKILYGSAFYLNRGQFHPLVPTGPLCIIDFPLTKLKLRADTRVLSAPCPLARQWTEKPSGEEEIGSLGRNLGEAHPLSLDVGESRDQRLGA